MFDQFRVPHVIYRGKTFQIEWYYTSNGEMPGYEFYQTLTEHDKARFQVLAQHLADSSKGTFLPKTHYNIEDAKHGIYAFKPHANRLLNFMAAGGKIIVTNGFHKQSQKPRGVDQEKIRKAIRFKTDYNIRVNRGDYYEQET